jgi:multiple sugar transport system ATP-binding protein
MTRVSLKQLSKVFSPSQSMPVHALRDLTLETLPGERLALLGPSGSGKSTLLRVVAGLEDPSEGEILFDDAPVAALPPHARNLAFVPQEAALFPHLNVLDNIAFGLRIHRVPKKEIETRVREIAEPLGLLTLLHRAVHELSGGERQRTCLARAFVKRPALMLLDEPLAALDAPMRLELRALLVSLQQRWKMSMLWVTHDQQEALAIGQRVAILNSGQLQQVGVPVEIYHRPGNRFVATFVGMPPMNLLEGSLQDAPRRFAAPSASPGAAPWSMVVPGDSLPTDLADRVPVLLGVRPEDLHLSVCENTDAPGVGTVEHSEFLGPETLVRVRLGGQVWTARLLGNASYPSGTAVALQPDFSHAHWFAPDTGLRLHGAP